MSGDEYLRDLLSKKANSSTYSQSEEQAYSAVCSWINEWKQGINNEYGLNIQIEMKKSGSRAKGTSLKGKSDIDIFVSITDTGNQNSTEAYYNNLYTFIKDKKRNNDIRKQNVSIGLNYAGVDIDITPAKRLNNVSYRSGYTDYNDHNMWSRKANDGQGGLMKTNIQKHIDLVRNSGLQNEIMCVKMWRNCHGLELPSIYIEILATEVLNCQNRNGLANNVCTIIRALKDTVLTRNIIDPSNFNNNISNSLSYTEKQAIQKEAKSFFEDKTWNQVIW